MMILQESMGHEAQEVLFRRYDQNRNAFTASTKHATLSPKTVIEKWSSAQDDGGKNGSQNT